MKPPFGTLNATIAKLLKENSPKYNKIVEPFGDGGTFSLVIEKKKPKIHILNIVDEELFTAFEIAKSGKDIKKLKKLDWVGSQETFDSVQSINADGGAEFMYKYLYNKNFAVRGTEEGEPLTFDVLKTGKDVKSILQGFPIMKVALKVVTLTNEDPFTTISGAGGSFLILLPRTPEDVESVRNKLSGISADTFFSSKVKDNEELIEIANKNTENKTSAQSVASIMVATNAVITNYENDLENILEIIEEV